ncbi:uncharacterized protein LY89DRAFT_688616 [Mollisia scopiformis]|uniref:Uncharacterized protein n=1 Tax=Mollisia scopiformis TaxID=149040 RepID=A0A194WW06_MOLSC|nr:uncharacterized protein LY89DRAFT_688616 [Mollisia scopiformis]KUJ12151.1 hypothetical protein LY89DRAFT_688616 [Mollisia scopiformis]
MHLKTPLLCAAALLSSAISASPTPGFNGLFEYAELDQYNTTEWYLDFPPPPKNFITNTHNHSTLNEDGSGRIYHAKPYSRQCKNIDEKTTSFSYYLALFTQAWGEFLHIMLDAGDMC